MYRKQKTRYIASTKLISIKDKIKSLSADENAVSYWIFVIFFVGIGAIGLFYSLASDLVDFFLPYYSSHPLAAYNTAESDQELDFLLMIFKFVLMPALIGLLWYSYQMSQKPERQG